MSIAMRNLLHSPRLHLGVLAITAASMATAHGADVFKPDDQALDRTAAMVSARPFVMGPPISDRAAWSAAAKRPDLRNVISQAEEQVKTPLPQMTDELYLDYSKTGNRRRGEAVLFGRRSRVSLFALAECVENRGRFLPAFEEAVRSICRDRTWVMPAHDGALDNFRGRQVTIDLAVAMLAWDLAIADSLLTEQLPSSLRTLIRQEMQNRVFAPYRRMAAGQQDAYWLVVDNNWNAVCLAGVTGSALTLIDDPRERAWYALAAAHYSRHFLSGFTPDGYCSEGVGYWNYGFGHYAAMAETLRRATRGGIDLLANPAASRPAAYGAQIQITEGVCPAFADCDVNARPSPRLLAYLSDRFGAEPPASARALTARAGFHWTALDLVSEKAPAVAGAEPWPKPGALRTWFPDAGVLICRPPARGGRDFGVAILGGHNAEHHNHNDVGTFMVVVGDQAVLPDIGAEVYTRRTFSAKRYESRALNSYGHAVPVVAGQLQRAGRDARAALLESTFRDHEDRIAFDIKSAYAVPSLRRLDRTFVYSRREPGTLTVTDRFAFAQPETFETALLTFGEWRREGSSGLRVSDGGASVRIEVAIPAETQLEVASEEIREDLAARRTATRIGLKLATPLERGEVQLKIVPED